MGHQEHPAESEEGHTPAKGAEQDITEETPKEQTAEKKITEKQEEKAEETKRRETAEKKEAPATQKPQEEETAAQPEPRPSEVKEPESEVPEEKDKGTGEQERKKGVFSFITEKITKKTLSASKFQDLFYELEIALMENNVALEVIEKIKEDLKEKIVGIPLPRGKIENIIIDSLVESIRSLFAEEGFDLLKRAEGKKPYVICFLGINGSGKTTSIAKIAHLLLAAGKSVVLAAADTFRAAAIDQLQLHADRLGVKLIKHDYGADAAAVAFDAVRHAEAKGADFVLIDTAGRMHSNVNLQDELKKIVRVAKPDLKIFVGEAITGNDCVEQAVKFNEIVGIDAIILTKADVDEKGGAFVSVSYVTKKPIAFIGMGQEYEDLKPFSVKLVMENLGLAGE
ncbi:MAG: signal recognition particle-docking protein FtsY [DPANN group archaeon]|nr:signal recognition particle-docking protein FtsY [DPANN group archaeon]